MSSWATLTPTFNPSLTLKTLGIPNTGPGYITKYTLPPIPRLPPSLIYTAKMTLKLNIGPDPQTHDSTHKHASTSTFTSPAFHSNFEPFNTDIDSNNSTTDHRPVSTTIAIPNNPLNIYHNPQSTIHYRPLNKNGKSHLTSILQPLDTRVSNYNSTPSDLSLNDIVPITDFIFSQLVTAYKRVTLQAHAHKPTGIEKKFNEQALKLNTQEGLNKQSLTTLQSLLNDWNIKKQSQNHKKLHYSLIHSKRITKTTNNVLHPRTTSPLSLYDTNDNLTSDPNAMCQSMGESLISLGGPFSFDIDTSFIDKMMTNSPKLPNNVPHSKSTRQFFDHLLTNAKL